MTAQVCAQHSGVPATYRCDGCQSFLCNDCVQESHVLLLCRLCGEMAVPLGQDGVAAPAAAGMAPPPPQRVLTVQERRRREQRAKPYRFSEALTYPFRGTGLYMYIGTLVAFGVLAVMRGILALLFQLAFWAMVVALQFKIVRTTADGENELPDWPDFLDIGTMIKDLATWLVIQVYQFLLVVPVMLIAGASIVGAILTGDLTGLEPSVPFSLAVAVGLWLGTTVGVMAYGAVGNFGRPAVLFVHHHVAGFLRGGADAVTAANIVFGVGTAVLVVQLVLESAVPWVGAALSSIVGTYWIFTAPHLSGVLFRRHLDTYEELYEG